MVYVSAMFSDRISSWMQFLWLNNLSLFGPPTCLDLNSYMCVFFFVFSGLEYHDFLLCFDARTGLSLFTVNDRSLPTPFREF